MIDPKQLTPEALTPGTTYYTYTTEGAFPRRYVGSLPSQSKAQTVYVFLGPEDRPFRAYWTDLKADYFLTEAEAEEAAGKKLDELRQQQRNRLAARKLTIEETEETETAK